MAVVIKTTSTKDNTAQAASISCGITVSAANSLLLVWISGMRSGAYSWISAVTNSMNLTQLYDDYWTTNYWSRHTVYYAANPPVGTNTITITSDYKPFMGLVAIVVEGVDLSDPFVYKHTSSAEMTTGTGSITTQTVPNDANGIVIDSCQKYNYAEEPIAGNLNMNSVASTVAGYDATPNWAGWIKVAKIAGNPSGATTAWNWSKTASLARGMVHVTFGLRPAGGAYSPMKANWWD